MLKLRCLSSFVIIPLLLNVACSDGEGSKSSKSGSPSTAEETAKDNQNKDSTTDDNGAKDSTAKNSMAEDNTAEDNTAEDNTAEDNTAEDNTAEEEAIKVAAEVKELTDEKFCSNKEKFLDLGGVSTYNGTDSVSISYHKRFGIGAEISIYNLSHPRNSELPEDMSDLSVLKNKLNTSFYSADNEFLTENCGKLNLSELDLPRGKYVVTLKDSIIRDYVEFTVERENICAIDELKGKKGIGLATITPEVPYQDDSGKLSNMVRLHYYGIMEKGKYYYAKYGKSFSSARTISNNHILDGYQCGEYSFYLPNETKYQGGMNVWLFDSDDEVVAHTEFDFKFVYQPAECEIDGLKQHTTPFLEVVDSPEEPGKKILNIAGIDGKYKVIKAYSTSSPVDVNSKEKVSELEVQYREWFSKYGYTNEGCGQYTFDPETLPNGDILFQLEDNSARKIEKRIIYTNQNSWKCDDDELKAKVNPYFDVTKSEFSGATGDRYLTYEYSMLNLDILDRYYILLFDTEKNEIAYHTSNTMMGRGFPCGRITDHIRMSRIPTGNYKLYLSTDQKSIDKLDIVAESSPFKLERALKCEVEELKGVITPTVSFDKAEYKVGEKPVIKMAGFPGGDGNYYGYEVVVRALSINNNYDSEFYLDDDDSCGTRKINDTLLAGEYSAKIRNVYTQKVVEGTEVKFKVVE